MSNSYQPREYQSDLISKIYAGWAAGSRRMMAQSPTGSGKTVLMGHIAKELSCRGERVLILAHRKELIEQAADKVGQITGLPVSIIKSGYQADYTRSVQVASVQSLLSRIHLLKQVDLVIVDEAHHSPATSYRKILATYPEAYMLGLTATPYRLNGTGFKDLYDDIACGISIAALIEQGFLAKYRMFADAQPMIVKGAKIKQGDYAVADLDRLNNSRTLGANLVGSYRRHANGLRCLVFAININHSKEIVAQYNAAGVKAVHLDGTTHKDLRAEALERFATGQIQVISNCQLFDEGFDLPALEAVQLALPTRSLSRYLQMVGRAMRPAAGKENAIIIDHTDNWQMHGLPDADRIWTLDGVRDKNETKYSIRNQEDGSVREMEPHEIPTPIQIELREIDRHNNDLKAQQQKKAALRQEKLAIWKVNEREQQERRLLLAKISGTTKKEKIPQTLEEWEIKYQEILTLQIKRDYKPGWIYYRLKELKPPLEIWLKHEKLTSQHPGWAANEFRKALAESAI